MHKGVKRMSTTAQAMKLAHDFPGSSFKRKSHSDFTWKHIIRPSDVSREYTIEIHYADSMSEPKVFVVSPAPLELFEGAEELPHVFDHKTQQICLHFYGEWNISRPLTDFIPWASKWLDSYETWVITGVWIGKSFHNGEYTY